MQINYLRRLQQSHLGVEHAAEDRERFVVVDDVRQQLQYRLTYDA